MKFGCCFCWNNSSTSPPQLPPHLYTNIFVVWFYSLYLLTGLFKFTQAAAAVAVVVVVTAQFIHIQTHEQQFEQKQQHLWIIFTKKQTNHPLHPPRLSNAWYKRLTLSWINFNIDVDGWYSDVIIRRFIVWRIIGCIRESYVACSRSIAVPNIANRKHNICVPVNCLEK